MILVQAIEFSIGGVLSTNLYGVGRIFSNASFLLSLLLPAGRPNCSLCEAYILHGKLVCSMIYAVLVRQPICVIYILPNFSGCIKDSRTQLSRTLVHQRIQLRPGLAFFISSRG